MKKVLITASINSFIDSEFLNYLIEFMKCNDYDVHICTKIKGIKYKVPKAVSSNYDVVLVINKPAFSLPDRWNAVKIYFINCDVLSNQIFLIDKRYDAGFKFSGNGNYLNMGNLGDLSILYKDILREEMDFYSFDIIFIINNLDTLCKVLWFINANHDKNIAVFSSVNSDLFNSHVTMINPQDFDVSLKSSKIVIGEGILLMKALLLEKPVIVVGTHGYGGIVDTLNVSNFIKSNFTGRIGGTQNEVIPRNLLTYEYRLLLKGGHNKEEIREIVEDKIIFEQKKLKDTLDFLQLSKFASSLHNSSFIANSKFGFISNSNIVDSIVFDKFSNQFISLITQQEYAIVSNLDNSKSFKEITCLFPSIPIEELENSLHKLLYHNFINFTVATLKGNLHKMDQLN